MDLHAETAGRREEGREKGATDQATNRLKELKAADEELKAAYDGLSARLSYERGRISERYRGIGLSDRAMSGILDRMDDVYNPLNEGWGYVGFKRTAAFNDVNHIPAVLDRLKATGSLLMDERRADRIAAVLKAIEKHGAGGGARYNVDIGMAAAGFVIAADIGGKKALDLYLGDMEAAYISSSGAENAPKRTFRDDLALMVLAITGSQDSARAFTQVVGALGEERGRWMAEGLIACMVNSGWNAETIAAAMIKAGSLAAGWSFKNVFADRLDGMESGLYDQSVMPSIARDAAFIILAKDPAMAITKLQKMVVFRFMGDGALGALGAITGAEVTDRPIIVPLTGSEIRDASGETGGGGYTFSKNTIYVNTDMPQKEGEAAVMHEACHSVFERHQAARFTNLGMMQTVNEGFAELSEIPVRLAGNATTGAGEDRKEVLGKISEYAFMISGKRDAGIAAAIVGHIQGMAEASSDAGEFASKMAAYVEPYGTEDNPLLVNRGARDPHVVGLILAAYTYMIEGGVDGALRSGMSKSPEELLGSVFRAVKGDASGKLVSELVDGLGANAAMTGAN